MPSTRRVNWEASPASKWSLSSLRDELIAVFQNPSNQMTLFSLKFPPMKSDITIYLLYLPLYFPYQISLALFTNLLLFHLLLLCLISNPSLFYPKIKSNLVINATDTPDINNNKLQHGQSKQHIPGARATSGTATTAATGADIYPDTQPRRTRSTDHRHKKTLTADSVL